MKPNHAVSEGAQYERKAMRERLRRRIAAWTGKNIVVEEELRRELYWVLDRQKRYDAKPGRLGKT